MAHRCKTHGTSKLNELRDRSQRLSRRTGDVDVIAGRFASGPTEDNTPALETALNTPHGIDIAPDGTLLIADTYNHQILKVVP